MNREQSGGEKLVEHLFRTEAGRLVAVLTRIFGTAHIQLAEDMVQETLITALSEWATKEIPKNPSGWLMQVAKRRVLNELKRNKIFNRQLLPEYMPNLLYDQQIDDLFLQKDIEDSQLRMIFTCCHPSIKTESQIALTLKTLGGFGIREVANALLTNEITINKRLFRAKKTIRESKVPFVIPQGRDLEKRLSAVCLTLYLMFNEGYNTSLGHSLIKKDLCLEAIRLARLLADHFEGNKMLYALLSLISFHAARFEARIDSNGAIVIFEDQDRNLWNRELISVGFHYLNLSSQTELISTYHIEAGIAAEHCLAKSFDETNWKSIYDQYELLYKLNPNPVIVLNLAIIKSKLEGESASLQILEQLENEKELKNYYLLPATQGVFQMKLKRFDTAIHYFNKGLLLTRSPVEAFFLRQKIEECNFLSKEPGS